MSKTWHVNDYVRRRIRELRKARGLTAVEFAKRLSLPRTSYVSMENGAYNIKLDHVHRALEVLRADIDEVWPKEQLSSVRFPLESDGLLQRQLFRLEELVDLSSSKAGLLLLRAQQWVAPLLDCCMSCEYRNRIASQLQEERFEQGHWFSTSGGRGRYYLFLATGTIDVSLMFLINRFLVTSSSLFDTAEAEG